METYCYNIEALEKKLYTFLLENTEEATKKKIERIKSLKDRKRSLISHWLMKLAVSEMTGKDIKTVEILRTETGRPYVKEEGLYVNTSHSGDKVVCIVSKVPVGIDTEFIRPVSAPLFKKIIKRAQEDLKDDQIIVKSDKLIAFFIEWTRREAYLKLYDLPLSKIINKEYRKDKEVHFKTVVTEDYVITVCYKEDSKI